MLLLLPAVPVARCHNPCGDFGGADPARCVQRCELSWSPLGFPAASAGDGASSPGIQPGEGPGSRHRGSASSALPCYSCDCHLCNDKRGNGSPRGGGHSTRFPWGSSRHRTALFLSLPPHPHHSGCKGNLTQTTLLLYLIPTPCLCLSPTSPAFWDLAALPRGRNSLTSAALHSSRECAAPALQPPSRKQCNPSPHLRPCPAIHHRLPEHIILHFCRQRPRKAAGTKQFLC